MIDEAVEDVRARHSSKRAQTALMHLILDTNILLSALLSPLGAPPKLLEAGEPQEVHSRCL